MARVRFGFARLARVFLSLKGLPVSSDKINALRKTCLLLTTV
jgi:hypothetical protein